MSRKTLAGALAAAALALSAQAAAAEDLKICVEGAYPPFSETTASGEVVGFDIAMANAMCAAMGATCVKDAVTRRRRPTTPCDEA